MNKMFTATAVLQHDEAQAVAARARAAILAGAAGQPSR